MASLTNRAGVQKSGHHGVLGSKDLPCTGTSTEQPAFQQFHQPLVFHVPASILQVAGADGDQRRITADDLYMPSLWHQSLCRCCREPHDWQWQ